jgi:allantoicase
MTIDLAGVEHGGTIIASSDEFYTAAAQLIRPDRARSMGEGWETSRRRQGDNDFVTIGLAAPGQVRRIEIDTSHFRYNATSEVEHWALGDTASGWQPLLHRTRLQPDTRHVLAPSERVPAARTVRLDAFPDGGISWVRLIGTVDEQALLEADRR